MKAKICYLLRFVRRYPFTCLLATAIWVLCLVPYFPETPLDEVSLVDKWTHVAMYGVLDIVIWIEYLRQHWQLHSRSLWLYAGVAPILMGGLVELAQAYCTAGHRSGEWLDFVADGAGVFLGAAIGMLLAKCLSRV